MTGVTKYYSVHDFMHFAIVDRSGYFNRIFDSFGTHYSNFKSERSIERCDLIIEIGRFKPDTETTYSVGDGKYLFGEDYLYIGKESYKGAKWRFQVQGLRGQKTVAKIHCNMTGRIFVTGNVIDFLIHLKLMEKGYPIVHASAVSKDGRSCAFSSRGGGGKTTVAMELASNGFNFIGDNYVMIHHGKIFSFPTSLSIFTYNLAPIIADTLNTKQRTSLAVKKMIHKATKGYAKIFTKINPKQVFGEITTSSELSAGFLLIPHTGNSGDQVQIEEIDLLEFVSTILSNQILEFTFFCRYIEEYSFFFPNSHLSLHWDKYKELLENNLSGKSRYYKIIVPRRYTNNVFTRILELVESV